MAFTHSDFVAAFPEFANTAKYPQASFTFWQAVAALRMNACRWGELLDFGAQLFIAHNMRESAQNAASGGALAGAIQGPVTAKTIDKLSKSQDPAAVTIADAGDWNATNYGVRYYQMAQTIGSGGRQF